MGHEQRRSQEADRIEREARDRADAWIGAPAAFQVHEAKGCPKCAADSGRFIRRYVMPEVSIAAPGAHLHCACEACGYQWRERCADEVPMIVLARAEGVQ